MPRKSENLSCIGNADMVSCSASSSDQAVGLLSLPAKTHKRKTPFDDSEEHNQHNIGCATGKVQSRGKESQSEEEPNDVNCMPPIKFLQETSIWRLTQRFANAHIEVDKINGLPEVSWLIVNKEVLKKFTITFPQPKNFPELNYYMNKWYEDPHYASFRRILSQSVSALARRLKWNPRENQFQKYDAEYSTESAAVQSVRAPADSPSCDHARKLTKTDYYLISYFCECANTALLHKTASTLANKYVSSLLEMASHVVFGDHTNNVNVVNPTNDIYYSFCMSQAGSALLAQHRQSKKKYGKSISERYSSATDPNDSTSSPSDTSFSSRSILSSRRNMHADCVVHTIQERPVYLLIAEVKSNDIGNSDIGQLGRQMLGGGMFQNNVFGLILNASEATLYRMSFCWEYSTIDWKNVKTFYFVQEDNSFNGQQLFELFEYLVATLDFGKNCISDSEIPT